jgi:hypothetical protein
MIFLRLKAINTGKSQKSRNQGFSYYRSTFFLLDDRRIQIWVRIRTSDKRILIQEARKHMDADPDPQHRFFLVLTGRVEGAGENHY